MLFNLHIKYDLRAVQKNHFMCQYEILAGRNFSRSRSVPKGLSFVDDGEFGYVFVASIVR
jgi:hypothetical protein